VTLSHLDGEIRDGRHHMQIRVYYEDTDLGGALSHLAWQSRAHSPLRFEVPTAIIGDLFPRFEVPRNGMSQVFWRSPALAASLPRREG